MAKSFYNRLNLPPVISMKSTKPTALQEGPLDTKSPQEVLDANGMYREQSYYEKNPDKLYMDFTQFDDYETFLNKTKDMKSKFEKLPLDIRAKYNHDPLEFFKDIQKPEFKIESLMDDKMKKSYTKYQNDLEIERQYAEFQQQQKQAELESHNTPKQDNLT